MAQDACSVNMPEKAGQPERQAQQVHKAPPSRIDMRGPVAAVAVVGSFVLLTMVSEPAKPGAYLPWTLNPTGYLTGHWYVLLYLVTVPAKELANELLQFIGRSILQYKKMDEGEGKVRKLEVLETVDYCYLAMNTMVEFIGMNHIIAFLCYGPVEMRLKNFGVVNGPLAFLVVMVVNDIIYYPFHLVAHRRSFYPYCHKQHHRQFVPFRGYADAANQHPLEQTYGFSIFIASCWVASKLTGLHAGTAWACFLSWAVLNICNHLAFDSNFHLPLPYPAYPRDHQMHHRFPQCNYSTLTSMCDRAFGTFRPYKILGEPIVEAKKPAWYETKNPLDEPEKEEPQVTGRPEAVPSPFSVLGLGILLVVATIGVERFHLGSWPALTELVHFVRMAIALVNVAVVCAASEGAAKTAGNSIKRMYVPPTYKSPVAEAVPEGHHKSLRGGREVFKPKLEPVVAKPVKRE